MIIGEMCPWHDLPLDGEGRCPLGSEGGYALCGNAVTVEELRSGFAELENDRAERLASDVDHPAHYGGVDDPFEPIKIIEARNLGFHVGNALKYMLRAGHKLGESEAKDLSKAVWYLNRRIEQLDDGED